MGRRGHAPELRHGRDPYRLAGDRRGSAHDRGTTWTSAPAACNQSDHESLSAGPPVSGLPTVGYPNILYNCSQTAGYNGYAGLGLAVAISAAINLL